MRPPSEMLYAEPESRAFPRTFRTRVFRWSVDALKQLQHGTPMGDVVNDVDATSEYLFEQLCSAYGREPLALRPGPVGTSYDLLFGRQLEAHVAYCPDLEVMDYIDSVFHLSALLIRESGAADPIEEPKRLGAEINLIFQEEGVGYRWTDGRLVRFDGEVTHTEAMVPALSALASGRFGHAETEFEKAVADFGRGAYRDALTNANAALESVLQVLTGRRGTAGALIKEAGQQGLLPKPLGASVDNIEKLMHGIPAIRAQEGSAHGLADRPALADERLARLVLTMTAAVIAFLADDGT